MFSPTGEDKNDFGSYHQNENGEIWQATTARKGVNETERYILTVCAVENERMLKKHRRVNISLMRERGGQKGRRMIHLM